MVNEIHASLQDEPHIPEQYRELVREVAEWLDAGMVCYIHPATREVVHIPAQILNEMDWEDEPGEGPDDPYDVYKKDLQRIESEWKNTLTVTPPQPHESFRFMERFTDTVTDARLREALSRSLHRSKPFRHFNAVIHPSPAREAWFAFKQSCLEEYVWEEIGTAMERAV